MQGYICVFDFETDGSDPNTCEPVQLASCMMNNMTLEIMPDSEFNINMRPIDIDDKDYYEKHIETIEWHAKNYGVTPQEIFDRWKNNIDQKQAWEHFLAYLKKYNKNQANKNRWKSPIRAGANIKRFDNIIIDRLCTRYNNLDKYGEQKVFHPRDVIDITDMAFYWLENLPEPGGFSMDILRPYFGIPVEGGHDALKDIRDEAWMIQKFMSLFRRQAPKVNFKGAYTRNNTQDG